MTVNGRNPLRLRGDQNEQQTARKTPGMSSNEPPKCELTQKHYATLP